MLSRVANSLYWLGRYLERADHTARFLAVKHGYAQELRVISHTAADQCWIVAWDLLAGGEEDFAALDRKFWRLAFDAEVPGSVLSCVTQARNNARGIRDAIPSEMWEELNVFHLRLLEEAEAAPSEMSEISFLRQMRNLSILFQGLRDNAMVRGDEWHFLRLGQLLESADMGTRKLQAMFTHPALLTAAEAGHSIDTLHLAATLRSANALEVFSRAQHALTPERVAEFLLLDARFPRSVEFSVQEFGASLHALSGTPHHIFSNDAEQLCGRLVAELRFASIDEIMGQGLKDYLLTVLGKLGQLGYSVSQMYFR